MAVPGSSIPFWKGGLILGLVALVISVQPLADEVGGNTSHDRDQKCDYQISHEHTPFLCLSRGGNEPIIA